MVLNHLRIDFCRILELECARVYHAGDDLAVARAPMNTVVQRSHYHDWGNLTLALVMLWTYFAFSQYLIIWSANLPEETTWYVARARGGWGKIA